MTRRIAATLTAMVAFTAMMPLVAPAGAQGDGPTITLARIAPWFAPGAAVDIDLALADARGNLEVAVTVHRAVRSRSEFDLTVDGSRLGSVIGTAAAAISALPEPVPGVHRFPLGTPGAPDGSTPAAGVILPRPGVYPAAVELRDATTAEPVDSFITHVVVLDPAQIPIRLSVAWVVPIAVADARGPDGAVPAAAERALRDGGTVARVVDELPRAPDVPLTLAPDPATLDAWAELTGAGGDRAAAVGGRLETLRAEAARASRQVLARPYASVDLRAFAAAGLDDEAGAQLARGADVLRDILRHRPDPRTFHAERVDGPALRLLREAGVDRLVVDPATTVPVFENLTPANPFDIRSSGRTFRAAAIDPGLAAQLDHTEPPALAAQRFLAGLTVVALELPIEERGVVVAHDDTWQPTGALMAGVLAGLTGHPAVRPVTLDTLFARVPSRPDSEERELADQAAARAAVTPGQIRATRTRIDSLATMLPNDDPRPAAAERLLLLAESDRWEGRDGRARADAYLDGVTTVIRGVVATIQFPGEHAITLTSRRSPIPISFRNTSDTPLRVRVRLVSEQLAFPNGDDQLISLAPRASTPEFVVEARTSGTFPLIVAVTSPDGGLTLGRFRLTVRSTAVSGVALALTAGAAVFLAVWWGNHILRNRRARRLPAPG